MEATSHARAPGDRWEEALHDLVFSAISRPTIDELFGYLTVNLAGLVNFDRFALLLHDPARDDVSVAGFYSSTPHRLTPAFQLPVPDTPVGYVLRAQKMHCVSDVNSSGEYPEMMRVLRADGIRTVCHMPLTSPSRRLGALMFAAASGPPYRQDDMALLQRATQPLAVAVENILNAERLQQERDRLKLLLEINNSLVSRLHMPELFDEVSAKLRAVAPHDFLAFTRWDEDRRELVFELAAHADGTVAIPPGTPLPTENTPGGRAFAAGAAAVYGPEELRHVAPPYGDVLRHRGIRSMCSVPLKTGRARIGVISIGSREPNAYRRETMELIEGIAGQLAIALENAFAFARLEELAGQLKTAKMYLEEQLQSEGTSDEILGKSPGIRRVLQQIETVAPTDATVLVYGETGSGKELVARAVHQKSPRTRGTFVKLNCAAIPTGLLESEMFGHERGAFTGAIAQKVGRFEVAHMGTLFLDEIGEIPLELQPKLLRVLQEKEFERLGGTRTIRSDARLIAATNRDLKKMAESHAFRRDLFYRLHVFPIHVPPLRDRKEDIPYLAAHFTQEFSRRLGKKIQSIPSESIDLLVAYDWPGNIRELQNLIERSVILSPGDTLHISPHELQPEPPVSASIAVAASDGGTMEQVERETILRALRDSKGVIGGSKGAAARLGLKRTTLLYRMEKLSIVNPHR